MVMTSPKAETADNKRRTPRLLIKSNKAPRFQPDIALAEAGRRTLYFELQKLVQLEPDVRAGDIEGVHQMRVATRRLRNALRVFGPYLPPDYLESYPRRIRKTARRLGAVRDLDVFLHGMANDPDAKSIYPVLKPIFSKQRFMAREDLMEWLDNPTYDEFILAYHALLKKTIASPPNNHQPLAYRLDQVAPRLIYTNLETIRGYDHMQSTADIETLHALRIDFKHFRYTLEYFSSALGAEVKEVITEVKAMQEYLGQLNDESVAAKLLRTGESEVPKAHLAEAIFYRQQREQRLQELVVRFPPVWQQFERNEVRHKLALAIAVL